MPSPLYRPVKAGISGDLSDKSIAIYEESLNKLNNILSDSNVSETTKSEAVEKHINTVKIYERVFKY